MVITFIASKCSRETLKKLGPFQLVKRHNSNSILEGIRILDLTRIVAGPFCTMILGDLGAEIIKIEKPGSGDEARNFSPPCLPNSQESCYFVALNRNKKSVCIDLKSHKGRKILYELIKTSDILVENYVPGKLDTMKLGYDDLKLIAPHLIYCSITGYGPDGPYRNRPGYDVIAASVGGLLHITGPKNGEPVKAGVAVTDIATGLYSHGAILAALIKRNRTGTGQKIDCNLLSTQISTLINIGSNYLNAGKEAQRWGTEHESLVPYQTFETRDGHFTFGIGSDAQFQDLCKKVQRSDLASCEKYQTNNLRVQNRNELINIFKNMMSTKTNDEWKQIFDGSTFPWGPVNSIKNVFDDPHVKSIGIVQTFNHPVSGEIKVVGPPVKYSDGGNTVRSAPPTLGEHTNEVLQSILGYTAEEIVCLKEQKVIQ